MCRKKQCHHHFRCFLVLLIPKEKKRNKFCCFCNNKTTVAHLMNKVNSSRQSSNSWQLLGNSNRVSMQFLSRLLPPINWLNSCPKMSSKVHFLNVVASAFRFVKSVCNNLIMFWWSHFHCSVKFNAGIIF